VRRQIRQLSAELPASARFRQSSERELKLAPLSFAMHHQTFLALFREILSAPTAPFHEYHVAAAIRARISEMPHVALEEDGFGNLLATYRRGRGRARLAFGAHMDHPGWVRGVGKGGGQDGGKSEPEFLGGVPADRLDSHPVEWFGEFGMWRLPPFQLDGEGIVHGRACDDLAGCAAVLALFMELEHAGAEATVHGIFTRAEEVGFLGAVALAKGWPFAKASGSGGRGGSAEGVSFVSLETSAPRGGVRQGAGPVIRVGDRLSVFEDAVVAELVDAAIAEGLPHQRALLDGGACEATAMNLYGIPAAGISLVLGNYHNCPPDAGIACETISLADAKSMVKLIVATTRRLASGGARHGAKAQLKKRLAARSRQHRPHERAAARAWREHGTAPPFSGARGSKRA